MDEDDYDEGEALLDDDEDNEMEDIAGYAYFIVIHLLVVLNNFKIFFCRFSVENAYIDEKEDACDALGEIAVNTG